LVAIILAVVGYGFVTGLAYKYVKKAAEKLNTFDVQEPPPPPEELPPPPPPEANVPPPPTTVVMPPAIVVVPAPPPVINTSPVIPPPPPITPPAPPAPTPPPPPAVPATRAAPRGNPQDWVTTEDYPAAAARAEEQGVVGFRLDVGTDGKVTNCTVTSSSGSALLDSTACNLLKRRGRFTPAKDTGGNPVPGAYISRIRWQLPQD
jgi:protein TonB